MSEANAVEETETKTKPKKHVTIGMITYISLHSSTSVIAGLRGNKSTIKDSQIYDNKDQNIIYFRVDKEDEKYKGLYLQDAQNHLVLPKPRKQWKSQMRFIFCLMAINFSIEVIYNLPLRIINNGGVVYLVCITFLMTIIGVPLLFVEIYLGQFSGRGILHCWRFAPITRGIGIAMSLFNLFYSIYHSVLLGWIFFYGVHAFYKTIPWNYCTNTWNTKLCSDTLSKTEINNSQYSVEQYWFRHILLLDREYDVFYIIQMNDESALKFASFLFVFVLIWLMTYLDWSLMSVILYFLAFFPVICGAVLIGIGISIPGTEQFGNLFLSPDFTKFYSLKTWLDAIEFVIILLSLSFGSVITMSSFSHFRSSITFVSVVVILFDFFSCIFLSIFPLQVLSYLTRKSLIKKNSLSVKSKLNLIFIYIPQMLGIYDWSNLWTLIYFMMLFSMELTKCLSLVEIIITATLDTFPLLQIHKGLRIITFIILFILQYSLSFLYIGQKGYIFLSVTCIFSSSLWNLMICLLEVSSVIYIYGWNNFSMDLNIISNNLLPFQSKYIFVVILPLIISVAIFLKLYFHEKLTINYLKEDIEIFKHSDLVCLGLYGIFLIPVLVYMIYYISRSRTTIGSTIYKGFSPDKSWGPSFKKYWMGDERYESKICYLSHNKIPPTTV